MTRGFVARVAAGDAPGAGAGDGYRVDAVIDARYRSTAEGRRVTLA
jgi:predicted dehydrogenase